MFSRYQSDLAELPKETFHGEYVQEFKCITDVNIHINAAIMTRSFAIPPHHSLHLQEIQLS